MAITKKSQSPYVVTGVPKVDPKTKIPTTDLARVESHTVEDGIPYVRGLPCRREISYFYPLTDTTPGKDQIQKQWTLFVLALQKFQARYVDDRLSYYQVASIHGLPGQPWDGIDIPDKNDDGGKEIGFCHHNDPLFPSWHRPYLALFEQRIWEEMGEVIESWRLDEAEGRDWTAARNEWRLPYWDWAARSEGKFSLPTACTVEKVPIYPPSESHEASEVSNPLWGFQNPEKDAKNNPLPFGRMPETAGKARWSITTKTASGIPWGECTAISRHGIRQLGEHEAPLDGEGKATEVCEEEQVVDENTKQVILDEKTGKPLTRRVKTRWVGLQGINNFKVANETLNLFFGEEWFDPALQTEVTEKTNDKKIPPGGLADAVNRLFTDTYTSWGKFATTGSHREENGITPGYLSIEFIHNAIHYVGGGGGGLGKEARRKVLASLPKEELEEAIESKQYHKYTGQLGDVPVAAFDPLFWLHHCNIDRLLAMWQVYNWETQNINEDLRPTEVEQETDLKPFRNTPNSYWTTSTARDWTRLNYQYDTLALSQETAKDDGLGEPNLSKYKSNLLRHVQEKYPGTLSWMEKLYDAKIGEDFSWDDYVIKVQYDRYALGGCGYTIEFQFGREQEGADSTPTYPIGIVSNFAGMDPAGCANCSAQKARKALSRGQVALTIPLIYMAKQGKFPGFDNERDRPQVERFLADNLNWDFFTLKGEKLSTTQHSKLLEETKIWIARGQGRPEFDDEKKLSRPRYDPASYEVIYAWKEGKAWWLNSDSMVLGKRKRGDTDSRIAKRGGVGFNGVAANRSEIC